jgi:hypothetical protein
MFHYDSAYAAQMLVELWSCGAHLSHSTVNSGNMQDDTHRHNAFRYYYRTGPASEQLLLFSRLAGDGLAACV